MPFSITNLTVERFELLIHHEEPNLEEILNLSKIMKHESWSSVIFKVVNFSQMDQI